MSDQQSQSLEDNLPMVNYIMLHRIYDMLTIMANKVDPEKTEKMIKYHEEGYLLGPSPSFTPQEGSEESDTEFVQDILDLEK
jgi:hypothetical protein